MPPFVCVCANTGREWGEEELNFDAPYWFTGNSTPTERPLDGQRLRHQDFPFLSFFIREELLLLVARLAPTCQVEKRESGGILLHQQLP